MATSKKKHELVSFYVDELVRYHLADALMAAADGVIAGRRGYLAPGGPKPRRRRKAK